MNGVELRNLARMRGDVRLAWLQGLELDESVAAIAAVAEMLKFYDTLESAFESLRRRARKYPIPVARQVIFKMALNATTYDMGLILLRRISREDVEKACEGITLLRNEQDWDKWPTLVKRILAEL